MKNIDYTDEFLQRRKERQKKARKRRLVGWFIFVMILLLLVGVILSLTVFFPIASINAKGSKIYTEAQIIKASGIIEGDNLLATAEGTALKRLKAKLPYIESIEFERKLPDSLTIKVKDAGEYACYYDGKAYYTVSHTGWVLKKDYDPPEDLFVYIGAKVKCKVGTAVEYSDEELKALAEKTANALEAEKININSIDISDTVSITLNVEDRFEVNLGTANFLEEKIRHLGSMIDNISPEKSGKINLSMWTNANSQGTFVEQSNE